MTKSESDDKYRPDYYKGKDGKDLFARFESGLLTKEQVQGFYVGNVMKYITRYQDKNGVEDLEKAKTYIDRLIQFEEKSVNGEDESNNDLSKFGVSTVKKQREVFGDSADK